MNRIFKGTEMAANVAIILAGILLGVVLVKNNLLLQSPPVMAAPAAPAAIAPGTKLSLPGIDWKANERTLVLALSSGCRFCTESAPFYQRLAQERAKLQNFRLVAVFSEPVEQSRKYLSDLGVNVDEVRQARLDSIGVAGTPTLIFADANGAVVVSLRGKLSSDKETELIERLK
jgi:thiol-disulfide isomerase/thioredoxin